MLLLLAGDGFSTESSPGAPILLFFPHFMCWHMITVSSTNPSPRHMALFSWRRSRAWILHALLPKWLLQHARHCFQLHGSGVEDMQDSSLETGICSRFCSSAALSPFISMCPVPVAIERPLFTPLHSTGVPAVLPQGISALARLPAAAVDRAVREGRLPPMLLAESQ